MLKLFKTIVLSIPVGFILGMVFAFLGSMLGDSIVGPDQDGNHLASWVWAINSFLIGYLIGLLTTFLFVYRANIFKR